MNILHIDFKCVKKKIIIELKPQTFFVFRNNQSSLTPKLKTACNLSAAETGHPNFDIIMKQVKKSFQENRLLMSMF